MAGKSKQLARPAKKQKAKASAPETADEFQEAADLEEETGGKWRAGDPAKSGRAFVRALEIYDRGLQRHPQSFDLAYNKARLMLEITQQPVLVGRIGLSLLDLLKQTLDAHRLAQRLNGENPDVLFNTSQVLASLAEQLSEQGDESAGVPLLQEALELLSACLSRQEMLLEQQRADFEGTEEDGGVELDPDEKPESAPASDGSGEMATIEVPVTGKDLLDTVESSMSALTTLVSLVEPAELHALSSMAQQLTEEKAPAYINFIPEEEQAAARLSAGLARAIFVAAFADAQFNAFELELRTYIERLDTAFDLPSKDHEADVLLAESQARTELVLSTLDHPAASDGSSSDLCWKQLSTSQDRLTTASKLNTDTAKERRADVFERKGSTELLRHRIALSPGVNEAWKRSGPTLLQNAQTFFAGAFRHAEALGEPEVAKTSRSRWLIAAVMLKALHGGEPKGVPPFPTEVSKHEMQEAAAACVDEGVIDPGVAQQVFS